MGLYYCVLRGTFRWSLYLGLPKDYPSLSYLQQDGVRVIEKWWVEAHKILPNVRSTYVNHEEDIWFDLG